MKTIGVLGGMGPEATAAFFALLVKNTEASRDADHVPVIVCSLPQIPDRTEAILCGGRSPLPALVRGVETLARAGADFAVMPCVSVHYFYKKLAARSPIPMINLLGETVADVRKRLPGIRKVGLLATTGTVRSGIVAEAFRVAGIEVLVPDGRSQRRVMNAIYGKRGVKAGVTGGSPRKALLAAASGLVRRGARAIVRFLDPMYIAARVCIRRAGGRLRRPTRPQNPSAQGD
jgi:aspartate racemase